MPHTTPSSLFKVRSEAEKSKYEADMLAAREEGRKEGYSQARIELLSWLENEYVSSQIDRRSPEAKALLKLARDVQINFFKAATSDTDAK